MIIRSNAYFSFLLLMLPSFIVKCKSQMTFFFVLELWTTFKHYKEVQLPSYSYSQVIRSKEHLEIIQSNTLTALELPLKPNKILKFYNRLQELEFL